MGLSITSDDGETELFHRSYTGFTFLRSQVAFWLLYLHPPILHTVARTTRDKSVQQAIESVKANFPEVIIKFPDFRTHLQQYLIVSELVLLTYKYYCGGGPPEE